MTYKTSGKLTFSDVKGLHHVDEEWWIDIGFVGFAFELVGYEGKVISRMSNDGRLRALHGYLWDGSSGPTIDGKPDPAPSLVHDMLYEALRSRKLPASMRGAADTLYRKLLAERKMGFLRRWGRYVGLRLVGWTASSPRKGPEYPKRTAL